MKLFIESTSLDMSKFLKNRDYVPTIEQRVPQMVADPNQPPLVVVKMIPRNQWTNQHKARVQLNAKAKYLLTCAKKIWDRL